MLSALKNIFSPPTARQQAFEMYSRVVEQSRHPVFFGEWKVEDTIDGRFDVIVLHLFLVISRCEKEASRPDVQSFIRYLSEAFFADMDRSLREMGASDTGVGMHVKKMAQAFYGRMKAYGDTAADGSISEGVMADMLRRNVYRERSVEGGAVASLAAYMGRNYKLLQAQPVDAFLQGSIRFSS